MKDVMLDLETLGTTNNSLIIQVGACYFDRYTGDIGKKICINIDINSSLKWGFNVDGKAIEFWLSQSDKARQSILSDPKIDVFAALEATNEFLRKAKYIWSHATFDFVILMNCLEKLEIKPLFHYRSARDIRTLTDLSKTENTMPAKVESKRILHNALDDCIFQVSYCVECFNNIPYIKKI